MAKKKGGMAGRTHPKDSNGQTAILWAHSMRRRTEFPDGTTIKVKFPEGANGGTWAASTGAFTASKDEGKVGTFPTWIEAAKALSAEVRKDGGSKPNGAAAKANGAPKTRRRRMVRQVSPSGDSAAISRPVANGQDQDAGALLISMAERLESQAKGFELGAKSLRSAAQQIQ